MATLSKLELEDSSQSLYILSELRGSGDSINVEVADGESAWEGSLSPKELEALARRSKISLENFISTTLKALSRHDLGELSFLYSVKHLKNNRLELTWKKHIVADNIKFQLGQVELRPSSSPHMVSTLLNFAISSIGELQQDLQHSEAKCVRLVRERQEAMQALTEKAALQGEVEEDLFSKFKVVLNEKKAKIRNLMESTSHLMEQNEELRRKLWESKSCTKSCPAPEEDQSHEEEHQQQKVHGSGASRGPTSPEISSSSSNKYISSGNSSSGSGGLTSLLGDVQCRAPSPPPAKKQRSGGSRPHRSVAELPLPLATESPHSARKTSNTPQRTSRDKELDSDELLDML